MDKSTDIMPVCIIDKTSHIPFALVFGKRGEKKFTIADLLAIDYSKMNVDDPKLMKAIVDFFGE